jgi:hypothetical protein
LENGGWRLDIWSMKERKTNISSAFQIASSAMTLAGFIWIGGFKFSALEHDVQDIKEDIKEIKTRLDKMEDDFHKIDVRVSIVEQQSKP